MLSLSENCPNLNFHCPICQYHSIALCPGWQVWSCRWHIIRKLIPSGMIPTTLGFVSNNLVSTLYSAIMYLTLWVNHFCSQKPEIVFTCTKWGQLWNYEASWMRAIRSDQQPRSTMGKSGWYWIISILMTTTSILHCLCTRTMYDIST